MASIQIHMQYYVGHRTPASASGDRDYRVMCFIKWNVAKVVIVSQHIIET
jgi:hypothetical protein